MRHFPIRMRARFRSSPCHLFAYGTLLTGTPDAAVNQLIRNALRPRGRAYIHGHLHDLGPYPGAVLAHDRRARVFGHVFTIEQAGPALATLDAYEGYHPHYPQQSEFIRRTATAMQLPCQRPLKVWVYCYNGHLGRTPRLRSGDYLLASRHAQHIGARTARRRQSVPDPGPDSASAAPPQT